MLERNYILDRALIAKRVWETRAIPSILYFVEALTIKKEYSNGAGTYTKYDWEVYTIGSSFNVTSTSLDRCWINAYGI